MSNSDPASIPTTSPMQLTPSEKAPESEKPISNLVALDWPKAESRVTQVQKFLGRFEGKPGHNPFIYYNNNIKPLVERYHKGERSLELYKLMLELPIEAPEVSKLQQPIGAIISGLPPAKLFN